jgi:hypothetical protein
LAAPTKPSKKKVETIELPPKEMNGKVTPLTGKIPIFIAALIKNCSPIKNAAP